VQIVKGAKTRERQNATVKGLQVAMKVEERGFVFDWRFKGEKRCVSAHRIVLDRSKPRSLLPKMKLEKILQIYGFSNAGGCHSHLASGGK
jgi:hypothetical protein